MFCYFRLFYVYPNFQAIFKISNFSDSLFINLSQHFCVLNLGSSIDSILCRPAQYSNSLSLYRARWSYPSAITFIEGSNTQIGYQDNVFKINDAPQERSNLSSFFKTIDVDSNLFFHFYLSFIFDHLHHFTFFLHVCFCLIYSTASKSDIFRTLPSKFDYRKTYFHPAAIFIQNIVLSWWARGENRF